jgi:hypothetical protein
MASAAECCEERQCPTRRATCAPSFRHSPAGLGRLPELASAAPNAGNQPIPSDTLADEEVADESAEKRKAREAQERTQYLRQWNTDDDAGDRSRPVGHLCRNLAVVPTFPGSERVPCRRCSIRSSDLPCNSHWSHPRKAAAAGPPGYTCARPAENRGDECLLT